MRPPRASSGRKLKSTRRERALTESAAAATAVEGAWPDRPFRKEPDDPPQRPRRCLRGCPLALFALAGAAGAASNHKLIGVVGENNAFKITLSLNGKIAKTLKAGTYHRRHPRRLED